MGAVVVGDLFFVEFDVQSSEFRVQRLGLSSDTLVELRNFISEFLVEVKDFRDFGW